jgi:hypothetical protein
VRASSSSSRNDAARSFTAAPNPSVSCPGARVVTVDGTGAAQKTLAGTVCGASVSCSVDAKMRSIANCSRSNACQQPGHVHNSTSACHTHSTGQWHPVDAAHQNPPRLLHRPGAESISTLLSVSLVDRGVPVHLVHRVVVQQRLPDRQRRRRRKARHAAAAVGQTIAAAKWWS